jgi:hypothetical protein
MPSAVSAIPQNLPRPREARAHLDYKSGGVNAMARPSSSGPSWTLFNTVVTVVIYLNMKDDIKGVREDLKDMRTTSQQVSRDMTDLRVGVAKIGGQLDQILLRLPPPAPPR